MSASPLKDFGQHHESYSNYETGSSQTASEIGHSCITQTNNINSTSEPLENDEICYITDEAGVLVSLDNINWNTFIHNNSVDNPFPEHINRCQFPSIIGKNLFEFIGGPKVQLFFRNIIYMLVNRMQNRFVYHWFCDSATHERKTSMIVTKLSSSLTQHLILWRSRVIKETCIKPHQTYLYATPLQLASPMTIAMIPSRIVCSYCKRILVSWNDVQSPENVINLIQQIDGHCYDQDSLKEGLHIPIIGLRGKQGFQYSSSGTITHLWLTATQYYGTFLDDDITINHGVCELCYEELALLFMPPGTFQHGKRML